MNLRPLVIPAGEIQQLQTGDDLDIPLKARVERLEGLLAWLAFSLSEQGFKLPVEVLSQFEETKLPL